MQSFSSKATSIKQELIGHTMTGLNGLGQGANLSGQI